MDTPRLPDGVRGGTEPGALQGERLDQRDHLGALGEHRSGEPLDPLRVDAGRLGHLVQRPALPQARLDLLHRQRALDARRPGCLDLGLGLRLGLLRPELVDGLRQLVVDGDVVAP
jgi:hypothetical protein